MTARLSCCPGRSHGPVLDGPGAWLRAGAEGGPPVSCWCPAQLGLPACESRETRARPPASSVPAHPAGSHRATQTPSHSPALGHLLTLVPQEPSVEGAGCIGAGSPLGFPLLPFPLGTVLLCYQTQQMETHRPRPTLPVRQGPGDPGQGSRPLPTPPRLSPRSPCGASVLSPG